jgi:small subunit ribosomal protein S3
MGQKTHPKGFRLITTENHLSNWYSDKFSYPSLIEEDSLIRSYISEKLENFLSISKIEILKNDTYVNVNILALYPRAKEMAKKLLTYFTDEEKNTKIVNALSKRKINLKKLVILILKQQIRKIIRNLQIKSKKTFKIKINFLKNQFEDANLIARYIADQLERRVPFRRVVKKTIKKVKLTEIKGIKIQVSGRLNGVEIARSEWKRDGKIPLHTLRAKIDYTKYAALTIYGIIGIKVWLLKN